MGWAGIGTENLAHEDLYSAGLLSYNWAFLNEELTDFTGFVT